MALCVEVCFMPKAWDPQGVLPAGAEWTHAGHFLTLDLLNAAGGIANRGRLSSTRADGGHISPHPS